MKEKFINMSIEETELSNEKNLEFFSYLIREGCCLEHYKKMADYLISEKVLDKEGNIL